MYQSSNMRRSRIEYQIVLPHHFLKELHDHLFLFEHKYSSHANKLLGWHSKCCHCSCKDRLQSDHHYQTCTNHPIVIEHNYCPPVNKLLDQNNNRNRPTVGHQIEQCHPLQNTNSYFLEHLYLEL